jgi:lysophospholipase L1-like esterase
VSIGGSKVRVRISNEYGTADVALIAVHIAKPMGAGGIDTSTDMALTFNGMANVTIPTGMAATSDPFDYNLAPLSDLTITIAFGNQTGEITGHPGSRATSYMTAGNHVSDASLTANATQHWYFISNVDVMAPDSSAAIVILGDSITDGRGSTTDGNDRWPDDLAKRLQADQTRQGISVLNMGIGGNCVVSGGLGPTAVARFDTQVLQQPGVKWIVVLEGINDIDADATAASLTGAFAGFVTKAHAAMPKLLIYGIPILPEAGNSSSTGAREQVRADVNTWIKATGHYDGVMPLDMTVQDTSNPPKLQSQYDSGDGLHLNPAGYKAMSDAIDLSLFMP